MDQANLLIKTFLSLNSNTAFVDVYHKMLKPDGFHHDEYFSGRQSAYECIGLYDLAESHYTIFIKIKQHEKGSNDFGCPAGWQPAPGTGLPK